MTIFHEKLYEFRSENVEKYFQNLLGKAVAGIPASRIRGRILKNMEKIFLELLQKVLRRGSPPQNFPQKGHLENMENIFRTFLS